MARKCWSTTIPYPAFWVPVWCVLVFHQRFWFKHLCHPSNGGEFCAHYSTKVACWFFGHHETFCTAPLANAPPQAQDPYSVDVGWREWNIATNKWHCPCGMVPPMTMGPASTPFTDVHRKGELAKEATQRLAALRDGGAAVRRPGRPYGLHNRAGHDYPQKRKSTSAGRR